jgi:hypothetical protein
VTFVIDPNTGAIGTAEPSFRSPLEFLADCGSGTEDGAATTFATRASLLGVSESLIEQLAVVSEGGCYCWLRDRLEAACGLGG